jgi:hypothetical protein
VYDFSVADDFFLCYFFLVFCGGEQENHFNGTCPSHAVFNACMHLVNVSVSYNEFSGPVLEPNTVLPSNLSFLLMAYNKFSGAIPAAMGASMNLLSFLDLSNNSLAGDVPAALTTKATTGTQINLSFNSLNVTKQPSQPGYGLFNCNPQVPNPKSQHSQFLPPMQMLLRTLP